MPWLNDLVTSYRDNGLDVRTGKPGWESFGVGDWTYGKPVAALKHHFVIRYGTPDSNAVSMLTNGYDTGSYFLNPPVANNYLGQTGIVYMIAGRVAQHGGKGVRAVLTRAMNDQPCAGRATAPDDYDGTSFAFWGTETHNPGDGTPMPAQQLDALIRMGIAECEVFGWTANRQVMHLESTTRKNDIHPGVITGAEYRRRVAAGIGRPPGDEFDRASVDDIRQAVAAGLQA